MTADSVRRYSERQENRLTDLSERTELVRSNRKTLSIQITSDGRVIIRAPLRMSLKSINSFVQTKSDWIEKHLAEIDARPELPLLTEDDIRHLADRAAVYIPERVHHYAPLVGVTFGKIGIRCQKKRWGSCSSKGNLSFNCLLMLAPPEVIDSVVVHELCHRKEMNHSAGFYAEVLRVFPEYRRWDGWLKKNGADILRRVPL